MKGKCHILFTTVLFVSGFAGGMDFAGHGAAEAQEPVLEGMSGDTNYYETYENLIKNVSFEQFNQNNKPDYWFTGWGAEPVTAIVSTRIAPDPPAGKYAGSMTLLTGTVHVTLRQSLADLPEISDSYRFMEASCWMRTSQPGWVRFKLSSEEEEYATSWYYFPMGGGWREVVKTFDWLPSEEMSRYYFGIEFMPKGSVTGKRYAIIDAVDLHHITGP